MNMINVQSQAGNNSGSISTSQHEDVLLPREAGIIFDGNVMEPYNPFRPLLHPTSIQQALIFHGYDKNESEKAAIYNNLFIKIKDSKISRVDLTRQFTLFIAEDSTFFYFDDDTLTLIPSKDLFEIYSMTVEKQELDLDADATNIQHRDAEFPASAGRGRQRHSGNRKVHSSELYTAYSRGFLFFPKVRSSIESGYQSDSEVAQALQEQHPLYHKALPFMLARQKACSQNLEILEDELHKGTDMNITLVNSLIRLFQ